GYRLGETDDARLRRGIVRLPGVSLYAHYRTHVDKYPPAVFHHDPRRRFGNVEYRLEVYLQHIIPLVLGHAEQQAIFGDARIVDNDVERSELRYDRSEERRVGKE